MSSIYKALADPTRRQILVALRENEMTAGDISDLFDSAKPTISRHLSVLKSADLVFSRRQGNSLIYQLNLSVLEEAFLSMMNSFKIDPGANNVPQTTLSKRDDI